jgi:hypothetical protein
LVTEGAHDVIVYSDVTWMVEVVMGAAGAGVVTDVTGAVEAEDSTDASLGLPVAGAVAVASLTGQTVVCSMVVYVFWPTGQLVTIGAQDVMVTSDVS